MKRTIFFLAGLTVALPVYAAPSAAVKCGANQERVWVYDNISSFDVNTRLKCGDTVELLALENGYARVRTSAGAEGYVALANLPAQQLATLAPASSAPAGTAVASGQTATQSVATAAQYARSGSGYVSPAPIAVAPAPAVSVAAAPPAPVVAVVATPPTAQASIQVSMTPASAPAVASAPVVASVPAPSATITATVAPAPARVAAPAPVVAMAPVAPAKPSVAVASPASSSAPSAPQVAAARPAVAAHAPVVNVAMAAPPATIVASAAPSPTASLVTSAMASAKPAVVETADVVPSRMITPSAIHRPTDLDDEDDDASSDKTVAEDVSSCSAFFSAYGVTPAQYKWFAAVRRKQFPGICPAPEPGMVDYVVIFTHDNNFYGVSMPEPVHTDRNGFSDWSPVTAVDDSLFASNTLDKAHREYAWVFRVNRGSFDPAKFSSHRRAQFTKIEHGSSKAAEDAFDFISQNGSRQ